MPFFPLTAHVLQTRFVRQYVSDRAAAYTLLSTICALKTALWDQYSKMYTFIPEN